MREGASSAPSLILVAPDLQRAGEALRPSAPAFEARALQCAGLGGTAAGYGVAMCQTPPTPSPVVSAGNLSAW
jgi:hypothetical protein